MKEGVAIVSLDYGVANPLNLELVTELSNVLQQVKADSEARGVVLTSTSEKFFSIAASEAARLMAVVVFPTPPF